MARGPDKRNGPIRRQRAVIAKKISIPRIACLKLLQLGIASVDSCEDIGIPTEHERAIALAEGPDERDASIRRQRSRGTELVLQCEVEGLESLLLRPCDAASSKYVGLSGPIRE